MIQSFSRKSRKLVAFLFFILFYLQTIVQPLYAALHVGPGMIAGFYSSGSYDKTGKKNKPASFAISDDNSWANGFKMVAANFLKAPSGPGKNDIGGPGSPEATSFRAVGSDNLVNLFTGDFSYSIPLLDVGGYPVNLFYSGGISMEQEASWVGLGWNINPGAVSRNMRGVPDDFNGQDTLKQTQNVKPNRTWGGEVGFDGEIVGLKQPKVNFSLGFSYNNYLGPAVDLGAGVSLSIPITENVKYDKEASKNDTTTGLSAKVGLNAKLNSRSGLTISPSLNANLPLNDKKTDIGVGLSTSYNSRTGIKELNLSSQATLYRTSKKEEGKKEKSFHQGGNMSSSISFARPSYIPTLRIPMLNSNFSGQVEFGFGMFGLRGAGHAQGYYSESIVPVESRTVYKPLVGFMYSENATGKKDAVMDFNRLNDGEVTPNTPLISAPQYAYDIFSIQGEGTGGTIRAYRGDMGFMRDNETVSKDNNFSIGVDIAPAGHYGGNWNIISTPTRAGGWEDGNNLLNRSLLFKSKQSNSSFENVYFRNPGEATVSDSQMFARIGGDDLVRFKLSGSNVNPRLESGLERFNKLTLGSNGDKPLADTNSRIRDKRTQVTTMLNASEASKIGLDKKIKNYTGDFNSDTTLAFSNIGRTDEYRKPHHISEIDVLEQSGMRYIYGLPVYSISQKDFTFSADGTGNLSTGMVNFSADEANTESRHMQNKSKLDGYFMSQETPAYASSFLLTGLLSPDFVDVAGDGITEDDLGGAVKFDYTKTGTHKWRTPRDNSTARSAHYNEGIKSEKKDNKATFTFGEREVWYLSSIESKSMIAIFKTGSRDDAKGVNGEFDGTINPYENANKKLSQIDLYTKAEIKAKGFDKAKPIKTVHFVYGYTLCKGAPDNANGDGKLTLKSVYFSYNGQSRSNKERYVFNYGDSTITKDNPVYARNASDRWGTYKNPAAADSAANPAGLTNAEYPYTSGNKTRNDEYAGAWSLKKILLPSGGQMEIEYEADDYAYVQNRRACDMLKIYGLGKTASATTDNGLYSKGVISADNNFVYIKLPFPIQSSGVAAQKQEVYSRYLQGIDQLAFKLLIDMPKGPEPLTVYANYDDYGLCPNSTGKDIIFIKLRTVDGKSPLSKSSIGFITENLPGQAFEGYEVDVDGIEAFLKLAGGLLNGLTNAFKNVDDQMRSADPPKARTIALNKSFVRLDNPYKKKLGGGVRVKKVLVKDNWKKMLTGAGGTTYGYTSTYGQEYDYTTTEQINGKDTVISSGVASYEPGIGSEENPFREILSFSNKMPLASAQYGAVEMPVLEGLFPSPSVGYSKVTVRSIHRKGTHGDSALRSAIGKQVTEFYTARDYPAYAVYTPMSNISYHSSKPFPILYKELVDRKVVSQGFLVETNDMHGKMKSQVAYSAGDEKTPLSYSYHYYKNTGKNGLNDKVDFVYNDKGGAIHPGNMGIDMELMTDVREFSVKSSGFNGQLQVDFFTFVPFPIFMVPLIGIKSYTENKYRAVTCTKLINYHAIEDSVIVMDKGSVIGTKTILYDAETGSPVVTKTANEFNDPVYNTSYPAYWAYSSMGPAYKNIDEQFSGVSFTNGLISVLGKTAQQVSDLFESGDELYLINQGSNAASCPTADTGKIKIWAYDSVKNSEKATAVLKQLIFIDNEGKPYNNTNVTCRIIRSGKRNNLGLTIFSATTMSNPIKKIAGVSTDTLLVNDSSKVVAAAVTRFKEKWQTDQDVIKRYVMLNDVNSGNLVTNGDFEAGNTGFSSEYTYGTSSPPYGYYNVGTNPSSWCSCSVSTADHTTNSGKMLMVDGHTTANKIAWQQTITVEQHGNYHFSGWISNSGSSGNYYPVPKVKVMINGSMAGSLVEADYGAGAWKPFSVTWNSGTSTTAVISLVDSITGGTGNNFELDDLSFTATNCGEPGTEAESCDGYLDKSINPYLTGLIGNFKPYRSYVYYGERSEADPLVPTSIRKNGYLKQFREFWFYDKSVSPSSKLLLPDLNNSKWVWNSELTKVNSKGQEVETRDALNRYTAAQYGFSKNLPVTVTQNARYGESFSEGFEDNLYRESVNSNVIDNSSCLNEKYIDFHNITNSSIVNTDSLGFKAHTGKAVLRIAANSQVVKNLKVNDTILDAYHLRMPSNVIYADSYAPTGDYLLAASPSPVNPGATTSITFSNLGMSYSVSKNCAVNALLAYNSSNNTSRYYRAYTTTQNIKVTTPNVYSFNLSANQGCDPVFDGTPLFNRAAISVEIKSVDGTTLLYESLYSDLLSSKRAAVFLSCGKYVVTCYVSSEIQMSGNMTCLHIFNSTASYSSDLTGVTGFYANCTEIKPIPAKDSMLNTGFALKHDRKMLFSAWIKEVCPSMPCAVTEFSQSNIQILANGSPVNGSTVKRTGAVIDGWQKIEGEFTLLPGDTTAAIKIINSNSGAYMYVDDIRVHPFNANMKSYAFDPRTLRLAGELDENNYATLYEYDEEGQLIRVKKETSQGVKTIQETRAAKQKLITEIVQ